MAVMLSANARRLVMRGLVRRRLTDGQIRKLNKLTAAEVGALLSARRKIGRGSAAIGLFIF